MISYPNVKINLGLEVLRRRQDGFHDIQTLFIPLDSFHDNLEIIAADDYSRTSATLFERYGNSCGKSLVQGLSPDGRLMITIARKEGVDWDPLRDLTAKAYQLLSENFDMPPVKIFLEKTSPVGAGLGGGSADAAYALKMLNILAGLGLSDGELSSFAARLGSDCALFIHNRPMFGEGRGEILSPYDFSQPDFLEKYQIRLVVPEGIQVSTAEAYGGIIPRENRKDCSPYALKEILSLPISEWKGLLVNDFEASVFKQHPELEEIKRDLYSAGAVYASMSGSGSSMFGIFPRAL